MRITVTLSAAVYLLGLALPYQSPANFDGASPLGFGSYGDSVPLIVACLAMILLAWLPRTLPIAGALLIGFVVFLTEKLIFWISNAFPTDLWGPGIWLTWVSALVSFLGLGLTFASRTIRIRVDAAALMWSMSAVLLALVSIVGTWMPWLQFTYRFTKNEWTFVKSGTALYQWDCCRLFEDVSNWWEQSPTVFSLVALIAVAIIIPLVWPRSAGAAGLMGIGVILLVESLSFIGQLSETLDVEDYFTTQEIAEGGATVEMSSLPGGWMALAAALAFVILGAFMLLVSRLDQQTQTPRVLTSANTK